MMQHPTLFLATLWITAAPATVMAAAEPAEPLSLSGYAIKLTLSMLLIFALMAALTWFVKRHGLGNLAMRGGNSLQVVASTSLGSRERVIVLQTGADQLVLGVTPGEIKKLHVLKNTRAEDPAASKFQQAMRDSQNSEAAQ